MCAYVEKTLLAFSIIKRFKLRYPKCLQLSILSERPSDDNKSHEFCVSAKSFEIEID